MKTNKKLKLNTKKVVILSNEQQESVQGGLNFSRNPCWGQTMPRTRCYDNRDCLLSADTNTSCPKEI